MLRIVIAAVLLGHGIGNPNIDTIADLGYHWAPSDLAA
jgi:hypothetical protein